MQISPSPQTDQQNDALNLTLALDRIRDSVGLPESAAQMFSDILRLLVQHLDADGGALILLEERGSEPEAVIIDNLEQGEALDLCRAAILQETPAPIENPYWENAIGTQIALRSQSLGGIILVSRQKNFTERSLRLLEVAEKQIDSAIIQARTIWKLAQRERELKALHTVSQLCSQHENQDSFLNALAQYLADDFNADLVLITAPVSRRSTIRSVINHRKLTPEALIKLANDAAPIKSVKILPTPTGQTELLLLAAPLNAGTLQDGDVIIGREAWFTSGDQRLIAAVVSQLDFALNQFDRINTPTPLPAPPISEIERAPLNHCVRYIDGQLYCNEVSLSQIAIEHGTPSYVYSLKQVLENYAALHNAFPQAEIHFSVKSNNNPAILAALITAGAGVDTVSAGEIHLARKAGAKAEDIVFAGVGKTIGELYYAISRNIGWINIENPAEVTAVNAVAAEQGVMVRVALRYNPDVTANTNKRIATGHHAAKFGLTEADVRQILDNSSQFPNIRFEGLHIHIGSQLGDTAATTQALKNTLALAKAYPSINTLNLGGGFPAAYAASLHLPTPQEFADSILPLLGNMRLILEPGRSIVADAGILLTRVQYVKQQGDKTFVLTDAGMTELIRPMLYGAYQAIVPLSPREGVPRPVTIAGPVCESTDVFSEDILLPPIEPGDYLAILTTGAYGAVMASNYNARLRPPEIVIDETGKQAFVSRRRETWHDLSARDVPENP